MTDAECRAFKTLTDAHEAERQRADRLDDACSSVSRDFNEAGFRIERLEAALREIAERPCHCNADAEGPCFKVLARRALEPIRMNESCPHCGGCGSAPSYNEERDFHPCHRCSGSGSVSANESEWVVWASKENPDGRPIPPGYCEHGYVTRSCDVCFGLARK